MTEIDCVVLGFNEIDFDRFIKGQRQFSATSGAYRELRTNSVLLGDRRYTYMDLMNLAIARETGRKADLNAFQMPSLGVTYLACYLLRRGFRVELVNFFNTGAERLAELLAQGPRSVAITTTYYVDDEPIREIIRFVREHNSEVPVIVGGPRVYNICSGQARAVQDLVLRSVGADIYIIDSQGEGTLAAILSVLRDGGDDLSAVPNLAYPSGPRLRTITRTPRRPESNDLNANTVDWSYFDPSFYAPTSYMRTSRSCSFGCAFCNYPAMAGALALTDIPIIEAELRYLVDHGVRNMIFVDDTFNVPLPRFKDICRMMIRNKFGLQWVSFFRCSNADEEAFDLMAESGCIGTFLGIESGDQRILKNMTKFARVDRYRYGIEQLAARGISTLASLILGFPGENEESVRNTLEFVNESRPTYYNVQLYYHDILAPVDRKREEYGITGSGYSWRHDTMSWEDAADWKDVFIRGVTGSSLLPLYGMSIWSLPYLLSNGLSMEQIAAFTAGATDLLKKGMDLDYLDPGPEIEAVVRTLFASSPVTS